MYIYGNILLNSFWNEKFFRQIYRENQNTHFMFNNLHPPPENRVIYEIMWTNLVEADMPWMTM